MIADQFENKIIEKQDKALYEANPSHYHVEVQDRLEDFKQALKEEYLSNFLDLTADRVWNLAWDFSCELNSRDSYHDIEYFYEKIAVLIKEVLL